MTLVDTSAWVEYLRHTGSTANVAVRELLDNRSPLATTELVVLEVLAGARDDAHAERLRRLLSQCEHIPALLVDHEAAATIYRRCRETGETIRSLVDCVIAAVAIRRDVAVLHNDRDFTAISKRTDLRTVSDTG